MAGPGAHDGLEEGRNEGAQERGDVRVGVLGDEDLTRGRE